MMVCAHCGALLVDDGPLGWVHAKTGSMYGENGHAVTPITRVAYLTRTRE